MSIQKNMSKKAEHVFADDVNERVLDDSDESEENFDLDFEKNLFSEFDGVFNNKAWTGKDHWKVKNIKKANASIIPPITDNNEGSSDGQSDVSKTSNSKSKRVRNKKLRTQIDLSDWSVADETVLKQAEAEKVKNERSIDIPIKNRKDPYYNLLPTDYHVTLEKMTVLFTRPQQKGNFSESLLSTDPNGKIMMNTMTYTVQLVKESTNHMSRMENNNIGRICMKT